MHEMVGLPGSLYFTWMGPVNNSLILDARKTFLETFIFFFLVHMSYRNLAYDETCWMASWRGTFIWAWLNISLIFFIWALVLLVASLLGNSTVGLWVCSAVLSVSLDLKVDGCELDDEDGLFGTCGVGTWGLDTGLLKTGGLEILLSTCFPDLRIWTMLHYFGIMSSASLIGKFFWIRQWLTRQCSFLSFIKWVS